MNKVSFHLKRPNENKAQSVFALYYVQNRAAKIYTGLSIHPKNWHPKRQRVKTADRNASIFNSRLDQIETDILSVVRDLENAHIPVTVERIRERYKALTGKSAEREDRPFLDILEDWITTAKQRRSPHTIRTYGTLRTHLKDYSTARGAKLTFDRMDREFLNSFIDYLLRVAKLQNSSLWSIIKNLKTFMKWALEAGYTENRYFESVTKTSLAKSGFQVQEPVMIRLTEKELQAIADADLSDSRTLDNARNLFVLQCCLGVRFGDLRKIAAAPGDYVSGKVIRLVTQKNRKAITIPLLDAAQQLLERGSELKAISNPKMNAFLKDVAKRAGLTESVIVTEFRGIERVDKALEKWEAVTTHTAKRTFVTVMIARNISTEAIMKVTGNSRATIDRYIYLDDEDVQREMSKAADLLTA